jgi:hypothetical protein
MAFWATATVTSLLAVLVVRTLGAAVARSIIRTQADQTRHALVAAEICGDLPFSHPATEALIEWFEMASCSGRLIAAGRHAPSHPSPATSAAAVPAAASRQGRELLVAATRQRNDLVRWAGAAMTWSWWKTVLLNRLPDQVQQLPSVVCSRSPGEQCDQSRRVSDGSQRSTTRVVEEKLVAFPERLSNGSYQDVTVTKPDVLVRTSDAQSVGGVIDDLIDTIRVPVVQRW